MGNRSRIDFSSHVFAPGIAELSVQNDLRTFAIVQYYEAISEAQLRTSAPWTDRTGNARSGLGAKADHAGFGKYVLTMFHRVPYGIWLEVKHAGRDAVILPTLQLIGPKIMRSIDGLWGRLR